MRFLFWVGLVLIVALAYYTVCSRFFGRIGSAAVKAHERFTKNIGIEKENEDEQ